MTFLINGINLFQKQTIYCFSLSLSPVTCQYQNSLCVFFSILCKLEIIISKYIKFLGPENVVIRRKRQISIFCVLVCVSDNYSAPFQLNGKNLTLKWTLTKYLHPSLYCLFIYHLSVLITWLLFYSLCKLVTLISKYGSFLETENIVVEREKQVSHMCMRAYETTTLARKLK